MSVGPVGVLRANPGDGSQPTADMQMLVTFCQACSLLSQPQSTTNPPPFGRC